MEISGNKRTHGSEGSDSDKEYPTNSKENQSIVTSTPNIGGWRKVEKKKDKKE